MPWLAGLRVGVGVGVGVGWAAGSGRPWSIALDAAKMAIRATPTAPAATVASVRLRDNRDGGVLEASPARGAPGGPFGHLRAAAVTPKHSSHGVTLQRPV